MKRVLTVLVGSVLVAGVLIASEGETKDGFFSKMLSKIGVEKKEGSLDKVTKYNKDIEPLYKSECTSCHMAYQPEFLPRKSWQKMMDNLENHFGVDATLDAQDRAKLLKYLLTNAADSKKLHGEFQEFYESIPKDKTLLKISDIPYFKKEHKKLPKKVITQKEVKSLSNCTACHKDANKGTFSEKAIEIPNYGKWDD